MHCLWRQLWLSLLGWSFLTVRKDKLDPKSKSFFLFPHSSNFVFYNFFYFYVVLLLLIVLCVIHEYTCECEHQMCSVEGLFSSTVGYKDLTQVIPRLSCHWATCPLPLFSFSLWCISNSRLVWCPNSFSRIPPQRQSYSEHFAFHIPQCFEDSAICTAVSWEISSFLFHFWLAFWQVDTW